MYLLSNPCTVLYTVNEKDPESDDNDEEEEDESDVSSPLNPLVINKSMLNA